MRRLSLNVEKHHAQHSTENRQKLLAQGGSSKLPCLKITDDENKTRWLYGSHEIVAYLLQRFAFAAYTIAIRKSRMQAALNKQH